MAFVYTLFFIAVISFICWRMMKRKSTPSNRYTPYDDFTVGIKGDVRQQDNPIQDTKHHIQYEEKAHSG